MGIITKEVEVRPTGKSIQHYKNKGYDVKHLNPIIVKVEDLPYGSNVRVDVLCDMCKSNTMNIPYSLYVRRVNKTGNYVCKECAPKKRDETIERLYGVKNVFQSEVIKEKIRQVCLERYNVDHASKAKEIKDRKAKTNLERFGVENPALSPVIKEKTKQTNIRRYGGVAPSASDKVKKKMADTNLQKYGYSNPSQAPEVKAKKKETFYKNGTCETSKQQLYLHNLYSGELNYNIKQYNVDICFPEEKLIIEYDGGGHNLNVKTGRLTQEEFDQKEIIRNNILKREGYRTMRIISSKDKLPSDSTLLQMLDYARNYFLQYPNHSWIEFNIDTSSIRSAEYKDGIFFDYGELRTINKNAVA